MMDFVKVIVQAMGIFAVSIFVLVLVVETILATRDLYLERKQVQQRLKDLRERQEAKIIQMGFLPEVVDFLIVQSEDKKYNDLIIGWIGGKPVIEENDLLFITADLVVANELVTTEANDAIATEGSQDPDEPLDEMPEPWNLWYK